LSFRRAVLENLLIQSLGPVSAFATVMIVARYGGPAQQGEYAQFKAWIDLLASVGSLGLPQGLIYVVNVLGAPARRLARWCAGFALAGFPVAIVASVIAARTGLLPSPSIGTSILVAASGVIVVLHSLWRGLYLTREAGARFALFTILPSIAVLFGAGLAVRGWMSLESAVLLALGPVLAISAMAMHQALATDAASTDALHLKALLSNGAHAFVQGTMMSLQPIAAYAFVRHGGGSQREVGFLNVGLFLVQGLSVPVSMIAPLLFVRWTGRTGRRPMPLLASRTPQLLILDAAIGLAAAVAAAFAVPRLFGPEYGPAIVPVQLVMLTLPLVIHVRVVAPALHAQGYPAVNTTAGLVRLVTFAGLALVLRPLVDAPEMAVALGWSSAEVLAAGWTLRALHVKAPNGLGGDGG